MTDTEQTLPEGEGLIEQIEDAAEAVAGGWLTGQDFEPGDFSAMLLKAASTILALKAERDDWTASAINWKVEFKKSDARLTQALADLERAREAPLPPVDGEWVLVPREPTEAMIEAAWSKTVKVSADERMALELCEPKAAFVLKMARRYRAMISASPSSLEGK